MQNEKWSKIKTNQEEEEEEMKQQETATPNFEVDPSRETTVNQQQQQFSLS